MICSSRSVRFFVLTAIVVCASMTEQAASKTTEVTGKGAMRSTLAAPNVFDRTLSTVRYSNARERSAAVQASGSVTPGRTTTSKSHSPLLAFGLSMLLPGAGQIYNGQYAYAVGFLGVEATTWVLNSKYNTDGHDRTEIFQKYNKAHWSEARYRDYLFRVYGSNDDKQIHATEISHNLPANPEDQQYYEQTGKYDQFSWGWDDTYLLKSASDSLYFGSTDWNNATMSNGLIPAAKGSGIPTSANRLIYEELRHDANRSFQYRDHMILVAALNRLVSGVQAYIVARHRQKLTEKEGATSGFSALEWQPTFSSRHTFADTPELSVRLRF